MSINKIILSEKGLYYGNIDMPKGWDIDRDKLTSDILLSTINKEKLPFSRTWDMLQTYLRDHIFVKYDFTLILKKNLGKFFKSEEISLSNLEVDPVDLRNSPDFVMLYGVNITKKSCKIIIEYDDNRRKGRKWEIFLENNKFIMFPSTLRYTIVNSKTENLNFLLINTYEYL